MNERIRELAQQSQLAELYDRYVEQCIKNADDDILDYDVIVKEFAELIVRQCALTAGLMEHQGRTGIGAQLLDNFEIKD
jgi:hypothetical protein